MASTQVASATLLALVLAMSLAQACMGSRKLATLVQPTPLKYHNGAVLQGVVPISILWYGKFTPTQKSIISDFLLSLTPQPHQKLSSPSVSQWWNTIDEVYLSKAGIKSPKKSQILLTGQVSDEMCSLGKSLTRDQISELAAKAGTKKGRIALVLTAEDVTVEGFCMSRCGLHGSDRKAGSAYIWVGNPATQCPGQCAWPFHQPAYGPQTPPLVAPNGDVGMDGMVINFATLLAGTVTNPYGDGFYQGPATAPLEAVTACTGLFGSGAYPGYPGKTLLDPTTGASYNAKGLAGRKYMLPAMWDPKTSQCTTIV